MNYLCDKYSQSLIYLVQGPWAILSNLAKRKRAFVEVGYDKQSVISIQVKLNEPNCFQPMNEDETRAVWL